MRECVNITTIDDALPEGSETLQAQLSLQSVMVYGSNEATVVFTLDQTNITIVDCIGKKAEGWGKDRKVREELETEREAL